MMNRSIVWKAPLLGLSLLCLTSCSSQPKEEVARPETVPMRPSGEGLSSSGLAIGHDSANSTPATPAGANVAPAPGGGSLQWTAPTRWQVGPERAMRAATYLVPATGGDSEGAECAIFLNIGGGVQANIDRWIGQFNQPDGSPSTGKARQERETINGFAVTTVDLTGTFNAGGMAMGMAQPSTPKAGYRLLGAIVESPGGEVFFKMTGPEKTMGAAQKEFRTLLQSIR
jgi:hypothetical protein